MIKEGDRVLYWHFTRGWILRIVDDFVGTTACVVPVIDMDDDNGEDVEYWGPAECLVPIPKNASKEQIKALISILPPPADRV